MNSIKKSIPDYNDIIKDYLKLNVKISPTLGLSRYTLYLKISDESGVQPLIKYLSPFSNSFSNSLFLVCNSLFLSSNSSFSLINLLKLSILYVFELIIETCGPSLFLDRILAGWLIGRRTCTATSLCFPIKIRQTIATRLYRINNDIL